MGLYFRKALKIGPLRVNLSKSGIGTSVGVKGARVSVGPKGTELNAGRGGLYFRKRLSDGVPAPIGWMIVIIALLLVLFALGGTL